MRYRNFKNEEVLFEVIKNNQIISGQYLCNYNSRMSYKINCTDKIFKNCIIIKGSFIGINFTRCVFNNVIFRETEFETVFEDCNFIDCIFSSIDSGFTMKNTKIKCFSQFFEEESTMDYYIKQMLEKMKSSK